VSVALKVSAPDDLCRSVATDTLLPYQTAISRLRNRRLAAAGVATDVYLFLEERACPGRCR
jgi:hypothetical protein